MTEPEPKCDVCEDVPVTHQLMARDFADLTTGHLSVGAWALCGRCSLLVTQAMDDHQVAPLVDRYFATHPPRPDAKNLRSYLMEMYQVLLICAVGDVQPWNHFPSTEQRTTS